jgi:hypothetical protein
MRREGARRVLGFVFGLWAFGVGTATVAVAQQSWDFYYGLGLKQLRNGDPRGAIESLMNAGGDQLVTDGRSPRLYSMTNHRVTASWKANDLEKDSVFRT